MSEQVEQPDVPEAKPEPSETEVRARAQGWVPEDEYQGEGKWRTAEDFLDRGELFAKIAETKRSAQAEIRRTQEAVRQHMASVRKEAYTRALADARAELKEAKRDGDVDAEFAAQDKMAAIEAQHRVDQAQLAQVTPVVNEPPPEFHAWTARNSWYDGDKNPGMTAFADAEGHRIMKESGGLMSPAEVLKEVEARVRREFPQRFVNPNRDRPGAVEGSTRGSPKGDSFQMTALETKIMNDLVKAKVLTKEQYISDLKAKSAR